ncbi:MAG: hypothetical protein AAGA65_08930 [Actinomycetota bacterium]
MHRLAGRPAVRWLAGLFGAFIAFTVYAANTDTYHPGIALVRWLPYGDKAGHLVLWGLLTLLVNLAAPVRGIGVGRISIPAGSVLLLAVVVVEEGQ